MVFMASLVQTWMRFTFPQHDVWSAHAVELVSLGRLVLYKQYSCQCLVWHTVKTDGVSMWVLRAKIHRSGAKKIHTRGSCLAHCFAVVPSTAASTSYHMSA